MSHTLYPGSIISKTAPTVTPPTGGEGGSASGIWTLDQADYYISQGTWPLPTIQGALYSWGANGYGFLGLGNTTYYSSPKQVGSLTTWAKISGSQYHSMAIKSDGTLWIWGYNFYGQLGLGNTTNYSSPKQVGALTTWSIVSAGRFFSAAIKTDGTLWTWGYNVYGELGLSDTSNRNSPVQVGTLTTWAKVASGRNFMLAVKTDGTLWSWGRNYNGQLGIGNTTDYSSPKQVGALTNWLSVSASGYSGEFSAAIKTNNTLWTWGQNNHGELGLNVSGYYQRRSSPQQVGALTNWAVVSCNGQGHMVSVKTDGTLWSWGLNNYGQLGQGDTTSRSSPIQVGSLTNWQTPSSGGLFSTCLKTDKTIWTWGYNAQGQLGLGNTSYFSSPKQIGAASNWLRVAAGYGFVLATRN